MNAAIDITPHLELGRLKERDRLMSAAVEQLATARFEHAVALNDRANAATLVYFARHHEGSAALMERREKALEVAEQRLVDASHRLGLAVDVVLGARR